MKLMERAQRIFLVRINQLEDLLLEDTPDLVAIRSALAKVDQASKPAPSMSPDIEGWGIEHCAMLLRDVGDVDGSQRLLESCSRVFPEECLIIAAAIEARFGDRAKGIESLRAFGLDARRSEQNRYISAVSLRNLKAHEEVAEVARPLLALAGARKDAYRTWLYEMLTQWPPEAQSTPMFGARV
jgi:hypothetical protein